MALHPGERSTEDAATVLKTILQPLHKSDQEAFVTFVDLVKAFDSVNRDMLWEALKKYGVPDGLVNVIKKLYENQEITIEEGLDMTSILSSSGVKQGDPLSPILFLFIIQAAIESLALRWNFETPNLWRNKNGSLNKKPDAKSMAKIFIEIYKILYADDAAFITLCREDCIASIKLIKEQFSRWGLTVHVGENGSKSKTEAMYIQPNRNSANADKQRIILANKERNTKRIDLDDGTYIDFTDTFTYLGIVINDQLTESHHVAHSIRKACGSFYGKNKALFFNKTVNKRTRARYLQEGPLNNLLYGVGCLAVTDRERNKMRSTYHRFVRCIAGKSMKNHQEDKLRMQTLLDQLKLPTFEDAYNTRLLNYIHNRVGPRGQSRILKDVVHAHALPKDGKRCKPGAGYHSTRQRWRWRVLANCSMTVPPHPIGTHKLANFLSAGCGAGRRGARPDVAADGTPTQRGCAGPQRDQSGNRQRTTGGGTEPSGPRRNRRSGMAR